MSLDIVPIVTCMNAFTLCDSTANLDCSSETFLLTFLPGETIGSTPRCALINILDDAIVENEEEFSVDLLSISETLQTINTTSVNVTIYEDPSDGQPYLL